MVYRLSNDIGNTAKFWFGFQIDYHIEKEINKLGETLSGIPELG